jgi:hypothetical protein
LKLNSGGRLSLKSKPQANGQPVARRSIRRRWLLRTRHLQHGLGLFVVDQHRRQVGDQHDVLFLREAGQALLVDGDRPSSTIPTAPSTGQRRAADTASACWRRWNGLTQGKAALATGSGLAAEEHERRRPAGGAA